MDHDIANTRSDRGFIRWCRRRFWNRGMAWAVLAIALLTVCYYQFENWRSARELATAHQRLIARLGTDDPLTYAPALVPDELNFFCIPVIQSWAVRDKSSEPFLVYHIPDRLVPEGFIWPEIKTDGDDGTARMDLKGWEAKRTAMGHPVPQGESPAAVLDRELGDGDGILPQLASGLDRPYGCYKPGFRELLKRNAGDPSKGTLPLLKGPLNRFMKQLALHLHAAARSGNARKARDTALISLRFGEGASSWGALVPCLIGLSLSETTFSALNDALACPVWDDSSLTRLQSELAKIDDLQTVEHAFGAETIEGYRLGVWLRNQGELAWGPKVPAEVEKGPFGLRGLAFLEDMTVRHGPSGWHDANIAFYLDQMLDMAGPKNDKAWLNGSERWDHVRDRLRLEYPTWYFWNPRRVIAAIMIPNLGSVHRSAGQCLFQRRCLIIGCALERYRITHGVYASSLSDVGKELALLRVNDPARPDQPLGYRLEKNGYVLWSAGLDGTDEAGDPKTDWIWRMRRD